MKSALDWRKIWCRIETPHKLQRFFYLPSFPSPLFVNGQQQQQSSAPNRKTWRLEFHEEFHSWSFARVREKKNKKQETKNVLACMYTHTHTHIHKHTNTHTHTHIHTFTRASLLAIISILSFPIFTAITRLMGISTSANTSPAMNDTPIWLYNRYSAMQIWKGRLQNWWKLRVWKLRNFFNSRWVLCVFGVFSPQKKKGKPRY